MRPEFKELLMYRIVVVLFSIALSSPMAIATQSIRNSQRVSVTGAVFTREISNPALGETYRDPSGLIWGSNVTTPQGKIKYMTQHDAEKYCQSIGAQLPTKEEFKQLATYLGQDTARGYDPYTVDGKTEVLPGIVNYWFWSAAVNTTLGVDAWLFYGSHGNLLNFYRDNAFAVRCVGR